MDNTEVATKIKWGIDSLNSQINFKVKHMMFSTITGSFKEYDGSVYTTGDDFRSAEIDFWLNPASIDTGNTQRDSHLVNSDFFDADNFKEINFTATSFTEDISKDGYEMYGDLTIKGITRKIRLDVQFGGVLKDPWGNDRAVFSVKGKINRKNWGLNWNMALEAGGILVSEDVWIDCEVQLVKQKID